MLVRQTIGFASLWLIFSALQSQHFAQVLKTKLK